MSKSLPGAIKRLSKTDLKPHQMWSLVRAWETTVKAVLQGSDEEFNRWSLNLPVRCLVSKKVVWDAFRDRAKCLMRQWVDIKDELENFVLIQKMPPERREYYAKQNSAGVLLPSQSHVDHPRRMGVQFWTKAVQEALEQDGLFYAFMREEIKASKHCWWCRGNGFLTKPKAVVVPVHNLTTDPDPDFTFDQTGRTQVERWGFEVMYKSDRQVCPECNGTGKRVLKAFKLPRMLDKAEMAELLGIIRALNSLANEGNDPAYFEGASRRVVISTADYEHTAKEHGVDNAPADEEHEVSTGGGYKLVQTVPGKILSTTHKLLKYFNDGTYLEETTITKIMAEFKRVFVEPIIKKSLGPLTTMADDVVEDVLHAQKGKDESATTEEIENDPNTQYWDRSEDQEWPWPNAIFAHVKNRIVMFPVYAHLYNTMDWDNDPFERLSVDLYKPKTSRFAPLFFENAQCSKVQQIQGWNLNKGKGYQLAMTLMECAIEGTGFNPTLMRIEHEKWAVPFFKMDLRMPIKDRHIQECLKGGRDRYGKQYIPDWARYIKFTIVGSVIRRYASEYVHQVYATHKLMWGGVPVIWWCSGALLKHYAAQLVLDKSGLRAMVTHKFINDDEGVRAQINVINDAIRKAGGRDKSINELVRIALASRINKLSTQLEHILRRARAGELPIKGTLEGLGKKLGLVLVKHEYVNPKSTWRPSRKEREESDQWGNQSPDSDDQTVADQF